MHFLTDADPTWPEQAQSETALWSAILGEALVACHHIGSTSVPGLAAKPIIDLLPVATDLDAIEAATPALEDQGYEAMGPYGLPGRLYFRKTAPDGTRLIHAHAYALNDPAIARHLAFRDLLRADEDTRIAYENIKRRADASSNGDINRYMDLKDAFIKTHEQIALDRQS